MREIANAPADERAALFQETAAAMGGIQPVIVEKDFWVCWVLDHLYTEFDLSLLFKGGTSLSKAYGLIERFSEDIDLAFDRTELGFTGDRDPEQAPSNNQRQRLIDELRECCREVVADRLVPDLGRWGQEVDSIVVDLEEDGETILVGYPRALGAGAYGNIDYVPPSVRLELGATSDHDPVEGVRITPYAAEQFPDHFTRRDCSVDVLAAERTFWEKATLLHVEPNRPEHSRPRAWQRLSRHAYDLFTLSRAGVAERALERWDLLERVCEHKSIYFRSGWADYEPACSGAIQLRPRGELESALRRDYRAMEQMIFGDAPGWEEILAELQELEDKIRGAATG